MNLFAANADGHARFEREARVVAALNRANNLSPAEIPQRLIRQLFELAADYVEALWALDQPPTSLDPMLRDILAALYRVHTTQPRGFKQGTERPACERHGPKHERHHHDDGLAVLGLPERKHYRLTAPRQGESLPVCVFQLFQAVDRRWSTQLFQGGGQTRP